MTVCRPVAGRPGMQQPVVDYAGWMVTTVRQATVVDAGRLHALAAATFPLACPPSAPQRDIDDFIARQLSEERFSAYLVDATRTILVCEVDGQTAGYTMLVLGAARDPDV